MGYFAGGQNFDVNGGHFIDVCGSQIQYTINPSMNVAGNNYSAEMYPSFRSHAQYTADNYPTHGPTQNDTWTYPGYVRCYTPFNNPPYTNLSHTHPPYTNPPYTLPPYSPTMRAVAEQGNIHYHYHSCQFVLVPYPTGQQPYPYPFQPGQPYSYFPPSGQQPYHSPPQPFATTAHQYQRGFHNSTVDPQHHRDAGSPPPLDPDDPEIAAIGLDLENQNLS